MQHDRRNEGQGRTQSARNGETYNLVEQARIAGGVHPLGERIRSPRSQDLGVDRARLWRLRGI